MSGSTGSWGSLDMKLSGIFVLLDRLFALRNPQLPDIRSISERNPRNPENGRNHRGPQTYLPTFGLCFYGNCRYTIHGSYGMSMKNHHPVGYLLRLNLATIQKTPPYPRWFHDSCHLKDPYLLTWLTRILLLKWVETTTTRLPSLKLTCFVKINAWKR